MKFSIRRARKKDLPEILLLLSLLSQTKPDQDKALKVGPSLQHGKFWGLIDNVVAAKDFRRNGIGRQLVNALTDLAKEKDCYKIVLTSRFSRPDVHQFWQKPGFKKRGFSFRMDL